MLFSVFVGAKERLFSVPTNEKALQNAANCFFVCVYFISTFLPFRI